MSDIIYPVILWIAENRKGPTIASRYLFLMSACMALSSCSLYRKPITIDSTSSLMDLKVQNRPERELYEMFKASLTVFSQVIPSYEPPSFQVSSRNYPIVYAIRSMLKTFLTDRESDGWNATVVVPLPNGDRYIEPGVALSSPLPEPTKWTPLRVGGKTQSFLTPQWGDVRGVLTDLVDIERTASSLFPSDSNRDKEIDEIVDLKYTNKERMIAEIWAGGPGTATPPGIWNILTLIAMDGISWRRQTEIYFLLNASLFQAGITAWKIKREYMQQRPIQSIMQRPETTIQSWNGDVSSTQWVPYQETDFVTPPFPDYISGHSTFSGAACSVLNKCLKIQPINIEKTIDQYTMAIISPIFKTQDTGGMPRFLGNDSKLSRIVVNSGISNIDDEYPYETVILSYNTWNDIADECGKSRIYGGIHSQCANTSGLIIGDKIATDITKIFKNIA
jgi:hypothetical protein